MTEAVRREQRRQWFRSGGWYFVVTVASAGVAAWVPFTHAAMKLGRPRPVVRNAIVFAAAAIVVGVLFSLSPTGPDGRPTTTAGQVLTSVGGFVALVTIAAGCLLQAPLRRRVFFDEEPAPATPVDPAVAAVLAARDRREQARDLVRRDPLLAKELRIGRPDLAREYDDGGLVDFGSAPASAIASVCELDESVAEAIVGLRTSAVGLNTVDDVFSLTDAPITAWDRIRDRAVIVPG